MEKLAKQFENTLREISASDDVKPNITSMRSLLRLKYIRLQMYRGWVVTAKGANYLKEWSDESFDNEIFI